MGQAHVLVDQEQGVHSVADGQPVGRSDHTAQLLPRPTGRARHGGEHTDRVGADADASPEPMGHAARADARPGLRAPRVRHRRVLGVRRGHRHQAREPSFGHVQDGTGLGPGDGSRPGAPRARCAQPEGNGRVRVPHGPQLQPHSARHNGGREGIGPSQADVGRVRTRGQ